MYVEKVSPKFCYIFTLTHVHQDKLMSKDENSEQQLQVTHINNV